MWVKNGIIRHERSCYLCYGCHLLLSRDVTRRMHWKQLYCCLWSALIHGNVQLRSPVRYLLCDQRLYIYHHTLITRYHDKVNKPSSRSCYCEERDSYWKLEIYYLWPRSSNSIVNQTIIFCS